MGGSHPKPKTDIFMTVPPTSPEPCLLSHLKKEHLLLAFFAGALLTLLLLAFVFLSMKSCRRCHSSSQALDSHSDPPTKLSTIQKDSLTYASMTFRPSEEKNNHLTKNSSSDLDPVVYAQVKVTNSQLPLQ
ncbi:transmembrane protein C1orf162 homolog isoform X1 [Perognathus longimembris pacificus]|uniref:transmembrane protein C1orf162 homolog isoform X1 n=1 Tax=Perognathus longimembris pacificus TaxID=214514 RepID=UPI0020191E9A|nr:transmembrane protein C1orf162 homolog isoform X1 [Perognathus longimembris pacificus]